jgi:hypothetical protein
MTLSSIHSSGRTMKFRNTDSTAAAGGSISVSVKSASHSKRTARGIKGALLVAILSLALLAPSQAFGGTACENATAGDATEGQYCNPVEGIQAGLGSGQAPAPAEEVAVPAESGPSLPFTGLDVAVLAVVAMALTGTGVVLRRLATIGDSEK